YVLSGIKCGHTSVRPSASAYKFAERIRGIAFPLGVKTWGDTVIVTSNMNRKDSNLIRGVLLQSIDGKPVHTILDSLYHYLSADGYNTTHKYQTLSNPGVFRSMYVSIYGFKQKIPVEFVDTAGNHRTASMNWYNPSVDTQKIRFPMPIFSKKERRQLMLAAERSMRIDTSLHTAFMEVNTFTKKNKLRSF